MFENEWLTVAEASEKTKIPVETIRRYIRNHGHHLKVKKLQKKYYLHEECMNVIEKIRELYMDGKEVTEVDERLAKAGVPLTITVTATEDDRDDRHEVHNESHDGRTNEQLLKELLEMKEMFLQQQEFNKQQQEATRKQEEFNKQLVDRLAKQEKYIAEKVEERDKILMDSMRQSLLEHKQALIEVSTTSQQLEKKKSFWSRLFGG